MSENVNRVPRRPDLPAPGEVWPSLGRVRCCEDDFGGSHYHCAECGEGTGMYGHYVTILTDDRWNRLHARELGVSIPWEGFTCQLPERGVIPDTTSGGDR